MEHFLTRRAMPHLLLRLLEAVVVLCLTVWCAATVHVLCGKYVQGMGWADWFAFTLLGGLPGAVIVWILRRCLLRRRARKIALTLAWEQELVITWEQLQQHADMGNVQTHVERLVEKGYLRNVTPDFDKLTIIRKTDEAPSAASYKCAMCGAALEKRIDGSWACRYCGTVAGKM